jgi:hypothetical protein
MAREGEREEPTAEQVEALRVQRLEAARAAREAANTGGRASLSPDRSRLRNRSSAKTGGSFHLHRGFGVSRYTTKHSSRAGLAGLTAKATFEVQSCIVAALSPLHKAVQRLSNKVDAAATQLTTLSKNVGDLEGRVRDVEEVEEAAKPDVPSVEDEEMDDGEEGESSSESAAASRSKSESSEDNDLPDWRSVLRGQLPDAENDASQSGPSSGRGQVDCKPELRALLAKQQYGIATVMLRKRVDYDADGLVALIKALWCLPERVQCAAVDDVSPWHTDGPTARWSLQCSGTRSGTQSRL